jgi:hypothetical protein
METNGKTDSQKFKLFLSVLSKHVCYISHPSLTHFIICHIDLKEIRVSVLDDLMKKFLPKIHYKIENSRMIFLGEDACHIMRLIVYKSHPLRTLFLKWFQ